MNSLRPRAWLAVAFAFSVAGCGSSAPAVDPFTLTCREIVADPGVRTEKYQQSAKALAAKVGHSDDNTVADFQVGLSLACAPPAPPDDTPAQGVLDDYHRKHPGS